MFREKKTNETIADLVKNARKEKGLSARKLATLLNVSHTEINNIESGIRVKPSIIVLQGIEQYLDVPFSITAKLAGYSDENKNTPFIRMHLLKLCRKEVFYSTTFKFPPYLIS